MKPAVPRRSQRAIDLLALLFYAVTALALALFAVSLLGIAVANLARGVLAEAALLGQTLESIGLVVIALAVFDLAKFLVEEEILRDRELRSAREARQTLTKFFTIVIIALSLEALVLVFEAKTDGVALILYPTALMAVGVLALVGLGLFHRLSTPPPGRADDAAAD
jgi:hypothetical protein